MDTHTPHDPSDAPSDAAGDVFGTPITPETTPEETALAPSRRDQIAARSAQIIARRRAEVGLIDGLGGRPYRGTIDMGPAHPAVPARPEPNRPHPAVFAAAAAGLAVLGTWAYLEHGGPAGAEAQPLPPAARPGFAEALRPEAPASAAFSPAAQAHLGRSLAPLVAEPVAADAPVRESLADTTADGGLVLGGLGEGGQVRLTTAGTQVVTAARPLSRVSVGSEDVASVNMLGEDSVLLTAKAAGTTQLIFWDDADRQQMVQVIVEPDLGTLRQSIGDAFPAERVSVVPLNGAIGLRGRVSSLDVAEQLEALASSYGPVLNLLEISGAKQVMLKVRFAEVSRQATRQLGLNYGAFDGTGSAAVTVGQVKPLIPLVAPSTDVILPGQLGIADSGTFGLSFFGGGSIDGNPFEVFVSALRDSNMLRMLAEPTATVISGESGSILAGGEVPYPVPQEEGIAIQFKEFGIRLDYTPQVLGDGRIRLKLATRASELDFAAGVAIAGTIVPATRNKENVTTVEMASGQSFVIGGLLSQNVVATKSQIPGLGDLPVIGALFRSVRYTRQETELVVMVTPYLVEPMNPAQTQPLPGEAWDHPNDGEFYLEGKLGEDANYRYEPPVPPEAAPILADDEPAVYRRKAPDGFERPARPEVGAVVAEPVKPAEVIDSRTTETLTPPAAAGDVDAVPMPEVAPEPMSMEVVAPPAVAAPRRETVQPAEVRVMQPVPAKPAAPAAPAEPAAQEPAEVTFPMGPAFIGTFDFADLGQTRLPTE